MTGAFKVNIDPEQVLLVREAIEARIQALWGELNHWRAELKKLEQDAPVANSPEEGK